MCIHIYIYSSLFKAEVETFQNQQMEMCLKPLCNTLQQNATHRKTLQHTATQCDTLQHTETHFHEYYALLHTATHQGHGEEWHHTNKYMKLCLEHLQHRKDRCVLQHVALFAVQSIVLQCAAVCCRVLQCDAVCFSVLQCVAVNCSAW